MIVLHVKAKNRGRVVNLNRLKVGEIVDHKRMSFQVGTALTDVITYIIEKSWRMDPERTIYTLICNGYTTGGLDIEIRGFGFQILCNKRLVRGYFPFNPFAAEFGSNYDVIVSVSCQEKSLENQLVEEIGRKFGI